MNKVEAIANYFIERGILEGQPVNPMKLQKLLYYAYGWYYALFDKKLFNESFEAWDYGPVVENIYHDLKHYGNNPIKEPITKYGFGDGVLFTRSKPVLKDDEEGSVLKHLNGMWKVYSKFDAVYLSNDTHKPDSPWDQVAKRYNYNLPRNIKIDDNIIKDWFSKEKEEIVSKSTPQ